MRIDEALEIIATLRRSTLGALQAADYGGKGEAFWQGKVQGIDQCVAVLEGNTDNKGEWLE